MPPVAGLRIYSRFVGASCGAARRRGAEISNVDQPNVGGQQPARRAGSGNGWSSIRAVYRTWRSGVVAAARSHSSSAARLVGRRNALVLLIVDAGSMPGGRAVLRVRGAPEAISAWQVRDAAMLAIGSGQPRSAGVRRIVAAMRVPAVLSLLPPLVVGGARAALDHGAVSSFAVPHWGRSGFGYGVVVCHHWILRVGNRPLIRAWKNWPFEGAFRNSMNSASPTSS
jgi:hypothetical protein